MDQLVVLSFGNGSLRDGFPSVTIQVWEPNQPHAIKFTGHLPAAPAIADLYRQWQLLYTALYQRLGIPSRIEIAASGITNVSEVELHHLCQCLSQQLNLWLNANSFRKLDQRLRTHLNRADTIRVIIETDDHLLQRLPWHLWTFFEDYPQAEVALSTLNYQRSPQSIRNSPGTKARILAILGSSDGIDLEYDQLSLAQLTHQADLQILIEPTLAELHEQLWQRWDMLFFAGHSTSQLMGQDETGYIRINATQWLTLDQLKYALQQAIAQGLKLAVFNSCDGLGLARSIADLHIPQVIVMREPIPDQVAHLFLKHFLTAFSGGRSLYAAMREARERLQGLETEYPCASWLPVICQNPATPPTHWQEWSAPKKRSQRRSQSRHQGDRWFSRSLLTSVRMLVLTSLLVTSVLLGIRHLGWLQLWELKAFDHLMQVRPGEAQDNRLFIITLTESDFQLPQQQQRQGSLSDVALNQLLEKLVQYQPRAIGLDIFRDFPARPESTELASRMQTNPNFFAICKVSDRTTENPGILPPPEVPTERQGFSDLVVDADNVLRRHLLAMQPSPTSPCTTPYALSAQLALHYLATEGITAHYTSSGQLQIGKVVLQRLQSPSGGYQQADTWGYQILLNYRSYRSSLEIAPTATLTEVLTDRVNLEKVRDRIVLIGVTAPSAGDYHATPYSANLASFQEIPGIWIQAQMVSQMISAVKDERPLLKAWSFWQDMLWIWLWAMVGGLLVWRYQRWRSLLLPIGLVLVGIYGLCLGFLVQGIWAPLIPSVLALMITSSSIFLHRRHHH
jgi:CHASE2 domain-containing sensor protein